MINSLMKRIYFCDRRYDQSGTSSLFAGTHNFRNFTFGYIIGLRIFSS